MNNALCCVSISKALLGFENNEVKQNANSRLASGKPGQMTVMQQKCSYK